MGVKQYLYKKWFLPNLTVRLFHLLDRESRRKGLLLMVLGLVGSMVELLGLASIIPYILLVAKPSFLDETPWLMAIYQQLGIPSREMFLIILLVGVLGMFLIKGGLSILIEHLQARFAFNVATNFSRAQIRHYLNQDYLFHQQTNSHRLVYEAKTIPFMFSNGILLSYITLLSELTLSILLLGTIAFINPMVLLAVLVVLIPVLYLGYRGVKDRMKWLGEQKDRFQVPAQQSMYEAVNAFPAIKLYSKEQHFIDRFSTYQAKIHRIQTWINTYAATPRKIVEISAILGILVISVYAYWADTTTQQLVFFLSMFAAASYKMMPSINRVFDSLMRLKNNLFALKIMEAKPKESDIDFSVTGEVAPLPFGDKIEFKNISYSYPESPLPVLNDVNLTINKGAMIGISGDSGEGKSTLLFILLQLLDQEEGGIGVDGEPVTNDKRKGYQQLLGFVSHDTQLLEGTLADNIAFAESRNSVDWEQVEWAIDQAHLRKLVESLPKGVNTQVGERGEQLSQGQKQRVAIARILYRDPPVYLLDEATNALDANTEEAVLNSFKALQAQGKSFLIISHRAYPLEFCDHKYVLDNGRLYEGINIDGVS